METVGNLSSPKSSPSLKWRNLLITKEYLEKRIADLELSKQNFVAQAQGQLAAVEGSIQELKNLLSTLQDNEPKKNEPKKDKK